MDRPALTNRASLGGDNDGGRGLESNVLQSCSVPVLAITNGASSIWPLSRSASERGRRDGVRQPRHRLLGWGLRVGDTNL
jgi:hypothetical protein